MFNVILKLTREHYIHYIHIIFRCNLINVSIVCIFKEVAALTLHYVFKNCA